MQKKFNEEVAEIEGKIRKCQNISQSSKDFPSELIDKYIAVVERVEGKPYTLFTKEDIEKYEYLQYVCDIKNEKLWGQN